MLGTSQPYPSLFLGPQLLSLHPLLYPHWARAHKPPQLDADPEARVLGSLFPNKAVPRSGGWDRTILNGNCVMISLDFWFSSLVQRFVQLCRASGGSVMYRWNEQAVLGMVAQIFASQEQLLMFTFPYAHRCANVVS